MRLTKDRCLTFALFATLALVGCDNRPKGTEDAGKTNSTTGSPALAGRTPRQVVDDFLRDLAAGKVTPGRLTPSFKKLITRPASDEEKKLGYSDGQAQGYLTQFDKATWVVGDVAEFGPFIVAHGRAELPGKKAAFAIRLTQRGDDFHADWIQLTERTGTPGPYPTDPALAAAKDTVRNMFDLLVDEQYRKAQALMSPNWKKTVSPLPPMAKDPEGLGYEPGFLDRDIRSWMGGAVSYTITDSGLNATKDEATFVIELESNGKKFPHTVRAKKDADTGHWLVNGFDK